MYYLTFFYIQCVIIIYATIFPDSSSSSNNINNNNIYQDHSKYRLLFFKNFKEGSNYSESSDFCFHFLSNDLRSYSFKLKDTILDKIINTYFSYN